MAYVMGQHDNGCLDHQTKILNRLLVRVLCIMHILSTFLYGMEAERNHELLLVFCKGDERIVVQNKILRRLKRISKRVYDACTDPAQSTPVVLGLPECSSKAVQSLLAVIKEDFENRKKEWRYEHTEKAFALDEVALTELAHVAQELQCPSLCYRSIQKLAKKITGNILYKTQEDKFAQLNAWWQSYQASPLRSSFEQHPDIRASVARFLLTDSDQAFHSLWECDDISDHNSWRKNYASAAVLNVDGSLVGVGSNPIQFFDTQTEACTKTLNIDQDACVYKMSLDDNATLLAALYKPQPYGHEYYVQMWDVQGEQMILTKQEHAYAAAISQDGSCGIISFPDRVELFDLQKQSLFAGSSLKHCYAIAAADPTLIALSLKHKVGIYDSRIGNPEIIRRKSGKHAISALAVDKESGLLACGHEGSIVFLWDIRFIKYPLHELAGPGSMVRNLVIGTNKTLAVDYLVDRFRIYDLQTGKFFYSERGANGHVYNATMSRNGSKFTQGCGHWYDSSVSLYEIKNFEKMPHFLDDITLEKAALIGAYWKKYCRNWHRLQKNFDEDLHSDFLQKTFEELPDHIQNLIAERFSKKQ